MKTDRLLAITVYLLNHEVVSASSLAERFEVSKRTIQRDMEALNMAGLPIISAYGRDGGYEIMDGFKLIKQVADGKDYLNIVTALKGYHTAAGIQRIQDTLEKFYDLLIEEPYIFTDFSASRENENIDEKLHLLDKAITGKKCLKLQYSDASMAESWRIVEPLALSYQWHSWYLFAYCLTKKDYRLFKLPRIINCEILPGTFSVCHGKVEKLLKNKLLLDDREYWDISLLCSCKVLNQALEYFHPVKVEKQQNGDAVLFLHLPFERMWFSLLLGFGNQIQVLSPQSLKEMISEKAKEILSLYT